MSATSPRVAVSAERREAALRLRIQGRTFRQIGTELGCSHARAHQLVVRALTKLNNACDETAALLRRLEHERLESLIANYWQAMTGGDTKAASIIIKAVDRQCRLWGLNAPSRFTAGPGEPLDPETSDAILRSYGLPGIVTDDAPAPDAN